MKLRGIHAVAHLGQAKPEMRKSQAPIPVERSDQVARTSAFEVRGLLLPIPDKPQTSKADVCAT
jgi:hypothetical protein